LIAIGLFLTLNTMKAPSVSSEAANAGKGDRKAVWKFGYGSNMSQDYLRVKKNLKPLDHRRVVLKGFKLSFPKGKGIDYVEPAFATLKRDPKGEVHGVATLLGIDCIKKLDAQEASYNIETHPVYEYGAEGKMKTLEAEVYTSRKEIPLEFPEGCCSERYRDVLVKGAKECKLAKEWIEKLENLPIYTPSEQTLKMRASIPPPSSLPTMTIEELAQHNGKSEKPIYVSSCGYIFDFKPIFRVYWGRDVTYRHVLHRRGVNLETNDDGGKSPFPRLSKLPKKELEYALCYRDRYTYKTGKPIAVLKEFWEEQEESFEGIFSGNSLSKL